MNGTTFDLPKLSLELSLKGVASAKCKKNHHPKDGNQEGRGAKQQTEHVCTHSHEMKNKSFHPYRQKASSLSRLMKYTCTRLLYILCFQQHLHNGGYPEHWGNNMLSFEMATTSAVAVQPLKPGTPSLRKETCLIHKKLLYSEQENETRKTAKQLQATFLGPGAAPGPVHRKGSVTVEIQKTGSTRTDSRIVFTPYVDNETTDQA